tara:strand:+ start:93380 stop:94633 length:1254 start_codon:yes stop_codon:yes gene_type:complete
MIVWKGILAFLIVALTARFSFGSSLNSFCHFVQGESVIKGTNVEEKLPIASVSKLITSYWSLIKLGKGHRFTTKVFYKKDSDGSYVVHFKGGSDPYFSKEFLHLVISELNSKGIKSVKELSFDENFKFVWNVNSYATAVGDYTPESPTPEEVIRNFTKLKNLTTDYAKTVQAAKDQGISMLPVGQLWVRKFTFRKSSEFVAKDFSAFTFKSSPLQSLLKEMNRNSNNYAANLIFEFTGGAAEFKKFIEKRLQFTIDDIEFFNGSGNKLTVEQNGNYNSARCSVVLKILVDFENVLKAQGLKFEDIVSVVGADSTSSSSSLYKNETTENSVIAKTGTVSPAILLAGIMSTKKGSVYFMYNMKTNGTRRDWRDAQRKIKTQITNLIQKDYNGGVPISYQSIKFFPFDKESEETTYAGHP